MYNELTSRDPEEVGPESDGEVMFRMRLAESIHIYEPDEEGKCTTCGSTQSYSVLHDDPGADFRQRHWHGGGDCMCFEDEDGPSYHEAMKKYAEGRR